jgi:hypothetical protein
MSIGKKFLCPQEARVEAERLVAPGETFMIEQFSDDCPECKPTAQAAESRAKYHAQG